MRKDAVYRMRVPKRTLVAIKRVAAAKGEDASEWGRAIIEAELRRDLAALQLRDQLQAELERSTWPLLRQVAPSSPQPAPAG